MAEPALYRIEFMRPNDGTWKGNDYVYVLSTRLPAPETADKVILHCFGFLPGELISISKTNESASGLLRDKTQVVDLVNGKAGRLRLVVTDDQDFPG